MNKCTFVSTILTAIASCDLCDHITRNCTTQRFWLNFNLDTRWLRWHSCRKNCHRNCDRNCDRNWIFTRSENWWVPLRILFLFVWCQKKTYSLDLREWVEYTNIRYSCFVHACPGNYCSVPWNKWCVNHHHYRSSRIWLVRKQTISPVDDIIELLFEYLFLLSTCTTEIILSVKRKMFTLEKKEKINLFFPSPRQRLKPSIPWSCFQKWQTV